MKIAVCLYGLPRGNERTWGSILKNVILPFQADLFVHTWDRPAMEATLSGVKQPGISNLVNYIKFFGNYSNNLKSFKIDKQDLYFPKTIDVSWGKVFFSNGLNNLTSIHRVSELINDHENDTNIYDIVIYTRPDIFYSSKVDISSVLNNEVDWLHGGKWNDDYGRFECEDLLMITKRKHTSIWNSIITKYLKKYYFTNNIYNILLFEIEKLGLVARQSEVRYSSGIYIVRPFDLKKIIQNAISFFKSKFFSL